MTIVRKERVIMTHNLTCAQFDQNTHSPDDLTVSMTVNVQAGDLQLRAQGLCPGAHAHRVLVLGQVDVTSALVVDMDEVGVDHGHDLQVGVSDHLLEQIDVLAPPAANVEPGKVQQAFWGFLR